MPLGLFHDALAFLSSPEYEHLEQRDEGKDDEPQE